MIEGRELASGGTIADKMVGREKPTNMKEAMAKVIEDWEIVLKSYEDEEEETPTYMQMYAMKGACILVREFQASLKELKEYVDREPGQQLQEPQHAVEAPAKPPQTQEPPINPRLIKQDGTIPVLLQPEQVMNQPPAPLPGSVPVKPAETTGAKQYQCRAGHVVDEATAVSLNLICPKCRMLLGEVTRNG